MIWIWITALMQFCIASATVMMLLFICSIRADSFDLLCALWMLMMLLSLLCSVFFLYKKLLSDLWNASSVRCGDDFVHMLDLCSFLWFVEWQFSFVLWLSCSALIWGMQFSYFFCLHCIVYVLWAQSVNELVKEHNRSGLMIFHVTSTIWGRCGLIRSWLLAVCFSIPSISYTRRTQENWRAGQLVGSS
jgi:hypothetical protein